MTDENQSEGNSDKEKRKGKDRKWRPSIRTYLILMNLTLLCLLFPALSILFLHTATEFRDTQLERTINQMQNDLTIRSSAFARIIANSCDVAAERFDFTLFGELVKQVVANDPEIIYSIVMNPNQTVIAHSDVDKDTLGYKLDKEIDGKAAAMLGTDFPRKKNAKKSEDYKREVRFLDDVVRDGSEEEPIKEVIAPIYNQDNLWGVLRFAYSLERLNREIRHVKMEWAEKMDQLKIFLLSMTAIFFTIGVVVAALFTRSFVGSVHILNDGVRRISEGDLVHKIRQESMNCVEFFGLSEAFNIMTVKLRTSYEKLDEYNRLLEKKVEERTRELREAQANLLQQAHESGMAEMAVGILHNIGNAITPAKVGTSLLLRKLGESPLRNHMDKVMEQIQGVVKETPSVSDKERTRLLTICQLLPESIREEYDGITEEIQRIKSKHEHIESIIGLQMRYARLAGDTEEIDVNRLVEDALEMLDEPLRKRQVQVEKEFAEVPWVRIEQAKLIQIIVNVLKNAYEAMDDVPDGERRLSISTRLVEGPPNFVALSVRDLGVGFSPDERDNLFKFGYSKKSRGSGFGLHSCANYLIANNGSITAESDGKGKGATFIVQLPLPSGE
ncbi:MAG: GHKL domain-containing protein [Desulfobacterales bacterium]|nr:GHKL domain-containing protein [Desulfobacterales bacterium]